MAGDVTEPKSRRRGTQSSTGGSTATLGALTAQATYSLRPQRKEKLIVTEEGEKYLSRGY